MSIRVLLIDDDASFRALAALVLGGSGFAVIGEAGTAAEGAAAAARLQPDAVLLDVGLPDRDGRLLARELAALPRAPQVLLTSSNPDASTPEDARRHGACGFVRKHDLPGRGVELLQEAC